MPVEKRVQSIMNCRVELYLRNPRVVCMWIVTVCRSTSIVVREMAMHTRFIYRKHKMILMPTKIGYVCRCAYIYMCRWICAYFFNDYLNFDKYYLSHSCTLYGLYNILSVIFKSIFSSTIFINKALLRIVHYIFIDNVLSSIRNRGFKK